jgi:DNA ligase D-like protein (predicted 3'-phosphoesterase)
MAQPPNLPNQLNPSKLEAAGENDRFPPKTGTIRNPARHRLRFLVQEHHARRLHWDFRLELDGVLKSWAVPKGPPTELGIKRLAVEVEDHPLSYFGFEGTIPKGGYGAGEVKVWDKGFYVLEVREPRKYHVLLKGRKLKGDYRLINFKDKNWLIYKVA